jgi:mono/diheme cytochrome c family protein
MAAMKKLLILLGFLAWAAPAGAGDALEGAATAKRWCAECHDVTGRTTSDKVPGWREVASDPERTPERLRRFLLRPHGEMPPIPLTKRDIDNLLAYIATLRP